MRFQHLSAVALPVAVFAQSSAAQSCTALSPSEGIRPSVASGYRLQVVATGLASPRGLVLDNAGHLLVVEAGTGHVSSHTINDANGCVTLSDARELTPAVDLNHGIQLSADARTLYASNVSSVMQWTYNAADRSASDEVVLINNMGNGGHSTRTILLSARAPGMIAVSRGSDGNLDYAAASLNSTHSTVKAFNLTTRGDDIYDFVNDGVLLGWGLRNSVGVAEHPVTGGIYTVENSADNIQRDGDRVSENNPAEEMNFHGYLNGTAPDQRGQNYGYPWCFAVWAANELPDSRNLSVGQQFAIEQSDDLDGQNRTDEYCAEQVAPRLSFQAHMAPLDMKFNNSGTEGWISFRGSWNRETPIGYKVSVVQFRDGEPTEPSSSTTALTDIVTNENDDECPDNCLRPVAMAIDSQGRIYFTSDTSGEIYLISRDETSTGGTTTTTTPAPPSIASHSSSPLALMVALSIACSGLMNLLF